ncbi:MAG: hypothetical protein H0U15_11515 [Geodermatophilaceae bacterium]|nr:hypothetical protein [Geodermatophilaceae bacterium]
MSVLGGRNGPGDAHEIRALVQAFATAVEADPYHASTMLCSQEREHFELSSESDMVLPKYPPKAPPIAVSDVVVDGDLASAVIRRPPASIPVRMYFRREGDAWTVCAPVEDIMYPSQADNAGLSNLGATRLSDDAEQIRALVEAFVQATRTDLFEAAKMLCRQERETFEEQVDPDHVLNESPIALPPIAVSDIVVDGDMASAMIRRPPASRQTRMYFLREDGAWTVCAPVEDVMYPKG